MQLINSAVGQGAANATSDVALIQAILLKTVRPAAPASPQTPARAAGPYLPGGYSGKFDAATGTAISAFQNDHNLTAPAVQPGIVAPNDATWNAMVAAIPAEFADLRVFSGHRTVWIAATDAELQEKLRLAGNCIFTPTFRVVVNATIRLMFNTHRIAIGVAPQGDRRDFERQYRLFTDPRNVTNAGPGESNHNFGGAVDLGFSGLKWLRPNGDIVRNEADWLNVMENVSAAETTPFWDALRAAGIASGAFRGPIGDRPHIQAWDDAGVSMSARLANLLQLSGTMQWSAQRGGYSSDLGLGRGLVPVGTAAQIWSLQATITIADLNRLRGVTQPGRQPQPTPPGRQPQPTPPGGQPQPATQADVTAMRQALRQQFELADANWQAWTPR